MFVQHATAALASARRYFGPFEVRGPARVLYMDFEMGRGTIGTRLKELGQAHGDTQDRLNVWAPFVDKEHDINLLTAEGMQELKGWVDFARPDVVVLDTIRSAFRA